MTDNDMLPPAGGPTASTRAVAQRDEAPGRGLLAAALIIAGSLIVGVVGGLIWAAVAPRVLYQVYTLNPPTAYATNPETSAFIAADGWYCFIGLAGGALIGLLGYLFGVRRYGPAPMVAIVAGATGAAFITEWLGHQQSGGPGFDHLLATSKPGTYLHAPISLGSHGALAFWPLAAAIVAGGIELVSVLKSRHRAAYDQMTVPGMASFVARPRPHRATPSPPAPLSGPTLPPAPGPDQDGARPWPRDPRPQPNGRTGTRDGDQG